MKTHWRSVDYRIESLIQTIQGLETAVQELRKKQKEIHWYDGLWFLEEVEPIYGIAFIALQNYINSSVYDRFQNLKKQYLKYKNGKEFNNSGRTKIELIIALANYYKHRDSPKDLEGETLKILNCFNFDLDKEVDIENSPIFNGFGMISSNGNLDVLVKVVQEWRERLWSNE